MFDEECLKGDRSEMVMHSPNYNDGNIRCECEAHGTHR